MLYFDCTDDYSNGFFGRSARVVFIFAKSALNPAERNNYRLRRMGGTFKDVPELEGYDKGRFIAHGNDGQLDQNIYPQLKELNRGISLQGELIRSVAGDDLLRSNCRVSAGLNCQVSIANEIHRYNAPPKLG